MNACIDTMLNKRKVDTQEKHSLLTSIMTMANEKISAFLLRLPPFKTSGAVHRGAWSLYPAALHMESKPLATVARPKSVIRA